MKRNVFYCGTVGAAMILVMAVLCAAAAVDGPTVAIYTDSEAFNGRGYARAALGYAEKALEDYSRAVELNPSFAGAHFNMATVLEATDRIDEAIRAYQQFVKYAPLERGRTVQHVKKKIVRLSRKLEGRR